MPVSPSRLTAFDILMRVERHGAYASDLLRTECKSLSESDQALTTELVFGVLRWRSLLDAQFSAFSSQPFHRLDLEVVVALRLAIYQIRRLSRVPVRAAIYESVELVKRARKKSAATFVNAVLRKFAANPPSLGDWEGQIQKAQSVPELAGSSAHPQWMVERWSQEFSFAAALGLCGFDQQVPPTFIRLRDHAAEADLCSEGISLTPGGFLSSARRVCFGDVTRTKVFADHRIVIQDEASQLIAALVGRGHSILDGCAAPGGKTWAIADRNPRSRIVAVELHAHRAEVLRKRIEAPNVEVWTGRLQDYPVTKLFDRVLVDVPCSGTGTLARHPEIKWRLQMTEIDDLRSRQLEILNTAMQHVAPKGRLVYSTCSLEPEEDESVVSEAVVSNPAFQFLDCRLELERLQRDGEWLAPGMDSFLRREFLRTLPGIHQCDGFFAAILERA